MDDEQQIKKHFCFPWVICSAPNFILNKDSNKEIHSLYLQCLRMSNKGSKTLFSNARNILLVKKLLEL